MIRAIRLYPIVAIGVLIISYFLRHVFSQELITSALYLFVGVVPLLFIVGFIIIDRGTNRARRTQTQSEKLNYEMAFELPIERMHGYKLVYLTGQKPSLTGLTGDSYSSDATATCTLNPDHVPPVAECECGFYAYINRKEAEFERSIYPGAFLIEVDLFGVGFQYERGYRAESQVAQRLFTQPRCQRCHTLPSNIFVKSYQLGNNSAWWRWEFRCKVCSNTFDQENKLSVAEMSQALQLDIVRTRENSNL